MFSLCVRLVFSVPFNCVLCIKAATYEMTRLLHALSSILPYILHSLHPFLRDDGGRADDAIPFIRYPLPIILLDMTILNNIFDLGSFLFFPSYLRR